MSAPEETIVVNANVEVTPQTLQILVQNAKQLVKPDEKGHYRMDTADLLSEMISRFLQEKDFEGFVKDPANYPR